MKVLIGKVGTGKTIQAMQLAAKEQYYIVCPTREIADSVHRRAREWELDIPLPITYREVMEQQFGRNIKGFIIDDVELFLNFIFKNKVKMITLLQQDGIDIDFLGRNENGEFTVHPVE